MWSLKSSQQKLKNSTSDTGERLRIARDLHDSLAQEISALGYFCDAAIALSVMGKDRQALVEIRSRLSNLGVTLRDEIALLRDEQRPFLALLEQYLEVVQAKNSLTITSNLPENLTVDDSQAIDLFRVVKEVILNVLSHANAKNLNIRAKVDGSALELVISDDGIDATELSQPRDGVHHFGRTGLHERMAIMGGSIEFSRDNSINNCRVTL